MTNFENVIIEATGKAIIQVQANDLQRKIDRKELSGSELLEALIYINVAKSFGINAFNGGLK